MRAVSSGEIFKRSHTAKTKEPMLPAVVVTTHVDHGAQRTLEIAHDFGRVPHFLQLLQNECGPFAKSSSKRAVVVVERDAVDLLAGVQKSNRVALPSESGAVISRFSAVVAPASSGPAPPSRSSHRAVIAAGKRNRFPHPGFRPPSPRRAPTRWIAGTSFDMLGLAGRSARAHARQRNDEARAASLLTLHPDPPSARA
jgi:hypothetical protein